MPVPRILLRERIAYLARSSSEPKHGRGVDGHRKAVRHQPVPVVVIARRRRCRLRISLGPVPPIHLTRHGVTHPVTQVHPRVPESHPGRARRQAHLRTRLVVVRGIPCHPREVRNALPQGVQRPNVADGVGTLVRRPQYRTRGPAPGTQPIGYRGVALQRVAQHVHPRVPRDGRRHGSHVVGIDDAERRLEPPMRNARLAPGGRIVEDGDAGGLAPRAGRGGYGDEGRQRSRHREALSQGRIDVVVKVVVGRRVARVQIGDLGRVDGGSSPECDDGVVRSVEGGLIGGVVDGVLEADVVRLDSYSVVYVDVMALWRVLFDGCHYVGEGFQCADVWIDEEEYSLGIHIL
mmetsp:Transcript_21327/g.44510  ORF Transcript_21327/g.44510 Transcript_21327/m.44510 type:complete len:348 (-) Transcript_21327:94-1137(-)